MRIDSSGTSSLLTSYIDMLDKRRGGERERDTGRGVNTSSSNPPRNSLFSAQRGRSHFSALEHQFLSPSKLSSSYRKLVLFSIPFASFLLLYLFFFSSYFIERNNLPKITRRGGDSPAWPLLPNGSTRNSTLLWIIFLWLERGLQNN